MTRAFGVCLGASSVSYCLVERNEDNSYSVIDAENMAHNGDPKHKLLDILNSKYSSKYPIAATGRKFRNILNIANISEPEATESALQFYFKDKKFDGVASLGGETFMVYSLDATGHISNVHTKNQCASGTGEFFMQQIKRMDLSLEETMQISRDKEPFHVSGRCSVFCKSDCTHALNKGIPKGEVAAGLCEMIADKADELMAKLNSESILIAGGISQNASVMSYLKKSYSDLFIPEEAPYLEALGAAIYAAEHDTSTLQETDEVFIEAQSSFDFLKPLDNFKDKVTFSDAKRGTYDVAKKYVLGLDVGSTTTKAVLIDTTDLEIISSIYLYTSGDPIRAARDCYKTILEEVGNDAKIIGVGVTGSGRHIAGLHAGTDGIINEIIAHANAAVHFDKDVDTIFEIGGQDAKYTYIVNQVPADYAMNEACSAGTGSFIEEAAYEALRINVKEIQDIAFSAKRPPNFSDQCAAFISSDIKTAMQEGISKEDVVAGLVYSICMNYVNRVKGNRNIGNKIFMQGGVCYNKAIPVAMAALTGADIIVPPDPGLMGAFGVALGIAERIELGIMPKKEFDLSALSQREVSYKENFICAGGKEKCDLKCSIARIEIDGKTYPFGGACDKYYNLSGERSEITEFDYVKRRNELTYESFCESVNLPDNAPTVGINLSFHTHSLYPLYFNFFSKLGFKVVLPEKLHPEGQEREATSFCFPAQLSLGYFRELIDLNPDYYFIPSIFEMQVEEGTYQRLDFNCTCVFLSGETYYLKQAFKDLVDLDKVIAPHLNFANGLQKEKERFIESALKMGVSDRSRIDKAFEEAVKIQYEYQAEKRKLGGKFLAMLEEDPERTAIVILGRPYNAFTDTANKGIPRKFSSKGVYVVPFDLFDYRDLPIEDNMYWEGGKKILKAAKIVQEHPQLFATYISNFSCGPDSMLLTTFREMMGTKPSLTLELDGHTADAGINTRIDAALDVISNYRKMQQQKIEDKKDDFQIADVILDDKQSWFIASDGKKIPLESPEVAILIPSMGDLASEMVAAAFRAIGYNAHALPEATPEVLKYGRSVANGKECLPIVLMAGGMLDWLENHRRDEKYVAFFNVQGAGNCRLGQYPVFMRHVIRSKKLENVAQVTLMNEDGFAGFGSDFSKIAIQAIIVSDVLDDVRSAIMANAVDPDKGLEIFYEEYEKVKANFVKDKGSLYSSLETLSKNIKAKVAARIPIHHSKYVALVGEIYVRRDGFSHKWLNKHFAKKGFVVKDAYISEWVFYVDYLLKINLLEPDKSIKKKFERFVREYFMRGAEKKVKKILEKSGYYQYMKTEIAPLLDHSKHILPLEYKGEPGLTLGVALHETLDKYCGVINIGPFGCMPTRFSEAITAPEMTVAKKLEIMQTHNPSYRMSEIFNGNMNIPFLTIETDGNVYPQVIEARIETFTLQAERAAGLMIQAGVNGYGKL